MSAKDADMREEGVTETGSLSPNIKSAADEPINEDTSAADTSKPGETVEIDGIPIAEEDIQFRSENIKKKDTGDLFVNVEGAEKRAREAERKKAKEAKEKEKVEKEKQKELEEKRHAEEEAKKQAAAKHERQVKKEQARKARQARHERSVQRAKKVGNFFFGGKHKFITLGIVALAIILVGYNAIRINIIEPAEYEKRMATTVQKEYRGQQIETNFNKLIDEASTIGIEQGVDSELEFLQDKINSEQNPDLKVMIQSFYYNVYGATKDIDEGINQNLKLVNTSEKSFVKHYIYSNLSRLYYSKGDDSQGSKYEEIAKQYDDPEEAPEEEPVDDEEEGEGEQIEGEEIRSDEDEE